MRSALLGLLFAAMPAAARAEKNALPIAKGNSGYMGTPCGFLVPDGEIRDSLDGFVFNGQPFPLSDAAKPCMEHLYVHKAEIPKGSGAIKVELRHTHARTADSLGLGITRNLAWGTLYFSTTRPKEAFEHLFVTEDRADKLMAKWYAHMREQHHRMFFGQPPLADLPDASKERLLDMISVRGEVQMRVAAETFKGLEYLVADLGRDESVYNEEKLSQAQRLALLLNHKLLAWLRRLEPLAGDTFQGVKLELSIPHESFISRTDETKFDALEIYAPRATLRLFAEADITARKFLDGCVILINENRTEVPPEL